MRDGLGQCRWVARSFVWCSPENDAGETPQTSGKIRFTNVVVPFRSKPPIARFGIESLCVAAADYPSPPCLGVGVCWLEWDFNGGVVTVSIGKEYRPFVNIE